MKKNLMLISLLAFVAYKADAQIGLHGNSDWKVPVPLFTPQLVPLNSGNVGFVLPNAPSISLSSISTYPVLMRADLMPGVPLMPESPKLPNLAAQEAAPPKPDPYQSYVRNLPPLPTIAPFAPIRGLR